MNANKTYKYFIGHPEDILIRVSDLAKVSKLFDKTFIVTDEAHCVIEWGDDFRPDYKFIADLHVHLPSCTFLACTATASKEAQKEITTRLGMRNPVFIRNIPIINNNVCLLLNKRIPSTGGHSSAKDAYNYVYKPLLLELFALGWNFPLTIVYCKLQWCAYGVELSKRLLGPSFTLPGDKAQEHFCVVQYHAQQPREVNERIIQMMSAEKSPIKLVFATVALGMGSDLRFVERVYHAGVPSSLEAYTQEIGRAGRSGGQCEDIGDQTSAGV
ncbi:ATP-dependent DNA helicase RecQ-like [Ostrea edulis]|uniref:ATP-dependent DNA helicase RecQ-like n=1 Tax=Ostrea edulis TaxID=37623 RepID=UPI0024AE8C5D|nr:ATP-dependent DNA helicase RecQ-like [Ostrea edulis]